MYFLVCKRRRYRHHLLTSILRLSSSPLFNLILYHVTDVCCHGFIILLKIILAMIIIIIRVLQPWLCIVIILSLVTYPSLSSDWRSYTNSTCIFGWMVMQWQICYGSNTSVLFGTSNVSLAAWRYSYRKMSWVVETEWVVFPPCMQ